MLNILYKFAINQQYNMSNQPLEYEDFYVALWGNISARIVSAEYIDKNREFIDSITFDYYRIYEMSDEISMPMIRRMIESVFFNLFRFQPELNNC